MYADMLYLEVPNCAKFLKTELKISKNCQYNTLENYWQKARSKISNININVS